MVALLGQSDRPDGFFLSQQSLVEGTHAELVDVLPTLLGLPVSDYGNGRVLWQRATR